MAFLKNKPQTLGLLKKETQWKLGIWPFSIIAGLAIFIRLYHLTSLSAWPLADEGITSFYSIELMQNWHWQFFYGHAQSLAFIFWMLALFFKLLTPSLFSLWLFPALFSILTLFVAYVVARTFFSKTLSKIFFVLFAFSFWHLYTARFCGWMVLIPLWEVLTGGALVFFLKHQDDPRADQGAYALAFLTAAGLFLFPAWPFLMVVVVGVVYAKCLKKPGDAVRGPRLKFTLLFSALCSLFLWAAFHENYGQYIRQLWTLGPDTSGGLPFAGGFLYLEALFIRSTRPFNYGPLWGGMLNPILGALFFVGAVECFRMRKKTQVRWLFFSLVLSLMPGFLSKNFEIFRILQVFPLLMIVLTLGVGTLWNHLPVRKNIVSIVLVLVVSAGLDIFHLVGPYHEKWGTPNNSWYLLKSSEFYRAYQILYPMNQERGPGAVLSDLWAHTGDASLDLATYSFNVALNPRFSFQDAKWVAVILDANFKPFLAKRFPAGHWYWLGSLYPGNNSSLMMGVIPVVGENQETMMDWMRADEALRPVTSWVLHSTPWQPPKPVFDLLSKAYDSMGDDPFLQSCFWEKVFSRKQADNDVEGMLEALRQGLKYGYPLAHIYNEEGILLSSLGRKAEARWAFQKALQAPLNLTDASENLKKLEPSSK